jgi:hypothetical protein
MDDNIEQITANKELLKYIRGEKQYKNIRPEADYARWRCVSNYLISEGNSSVKNQIFNTLLELLESKNWKDLYAVAGICQDIDSPDIDKKFEQMMLKSDFFSLPDSLVGFTSKYAIKKRLNPVAVKVVVNAIKKNRIDWVVTLTSSNQDEQEAYWNYCDKVIEDVLLEMKENEKAEVLEKVAFWKDKIMKIIHQLNQGKNPKP